MNMEALVICASVGRVREILEKHGKIAMLDFEMLSLSGDIDLKMKKQRQVTQAATKNGSRNFPIQLYSSCKLTLHLLLGEPTWYTGF